MDKELEELAKQQWYTQGIAGKAGVLTSFGSTKAMQQGVGFSYKAIIGIYKDGYSEWKYLEKDLEEHAKIILDKLAKNPEYLKEKRKQYNQEFEEVNKLFKRVYNAKEIPEEELFEIVYDFKTPLETTVGTAHLLESISLRLEEDIRNALTKKTSGKELNQDFALLTSPVTRSFISKKEEALWQINIVQEKEKKKLAEQFIEDFFWIESSYSGSKKLTVESVLKEASKMKFFEKPDFEELKAKKERIFEKYLLSEKEKRLVQWTEFSIDWQDDRKEKILRGIYALSSIHWELSKRYGLELNYLQQLMPHEILEAIRGKKVEEIARRRLKGSLFVLKSDGILAFEGKEFEEFYKAINKQKKGNGSLMGSSASLGTASGPVKVCTTLESLEKVKEGDILVASMTRPEYMLAMKKAAAIVTDEGGVLCHAAIVSRELGIPCVVGTKIATKVLKDNDLVEVRANHGMVRKIK